MIWQRVARFLPGRPGLMLILGVAVVVVFAVGFADQALTRQAMVAQYSQAKAKVERLEEQNRLLQQELDRAQQGQLVPQKAWEYFGRTPKGTRVIVAGAPADAPTGPAVGSVAARGAPAVDRTPSWLAFLKRLIKP